MALDTWNNAGDEPGRLTHLDDRNDRAVLVQGSGGPAQIVELLCHESAPSLPATMVTRRHRRPHGISKVKTRTPTRLICGEGRADGEATDARTRPGPSLPDPGQAVAARHQNGGTSIPL